MGNNSPLIVLGIVILTMVIAIGTGTISPESLNISAPDRTDKTSQQVEVESPFISFTDKVMKANEMFGNFISIMIFAFVILIIVLVGIWVLFAINPISESKQKLDDVEESLRGMEMRAVRDSPVRGRHRYGTRTEPKKRAREIYEALYSSDKVVKDLMETGGFDPRDFKKRSAQEDETKIETILCPKCKKVHIQTDEEGCWFCLYRWGDNIE